MSPPKNLHLEANPDTGVLTVSWESSTTPGECHVHLRTRVHSSPRQTPFREKEDAATQLSP